jgi:glycosyltransferase involved in cell wall biosynthesis
MKVSVIVPLYNLANYVGETIESVLNQTMQDFEIIVVDDCSTDNSLQVAHEWAVRDPRIKVIAHPINLGLPATRNTAIAAAEGEFILPLDSDDKIDPQYLEKTLLYMTDGVGVVSTWMHIFGARPELAGHKGSCYPIFPPTQDEILNGNTMPVCSLIRKQTLRDVGGYPEEMSEGSEDWALWVKIVVNGTWRVVICPEYLFHYRTRPGSMSRQATMMPFLQAREKIRRLYGS